MRIISDVYRKYFSQKFEKKEPVIKDCVDIVQNDLIQEIFAPDPRTGWPTNALSLVLNSNTAREVQEFVKANLVSPLPVRPSSPDDDTAFGTMSYRSEQYGQEINSYYERLQNFIDDENEKDSSLSDDSDSGSDSSES